MTSKAPTAMVSSNCRATIAEVQALTGLSRQFLRAAITAGELKAKVIGKGWRVKRSDLQEYIDKLLNHRFFTNFNGGFTCAKLY